MRTNTRRSLVVVACLVVASSVEAQALAPGEYSVDIVDLPVLGSARAVGMGGAFASVGEGISAVGWNPAAAGARATHERDWFEWEVGLGAMFPTKSSSTRFFGNAGDGGVRTDGFSYFDTGLRMQFGPAGVAILARPRIFEVGDLDVRSVLGHADLGWSFLGGDVLAGIGVRFVELGIDRGDTPLLGITGAGFEAGVTYAPTALPFRVAAVVRSTIEADDVTGEPVAAFAMPASVVAPWELAFGGSFGFGRAPFNAHPPRARRRRERQRYERLVFVTTRRTVDLAATIPGPDDDEPVLEDSLDVAPALVEPAPPRPRYGVVSLDVVLAGRTANGVGLDGFLTQTRRTWGERMTASPRIGVEGEPWRDRMKLRGGLYLEPDRTSLADPRVHFTHGFDLRLFRWDFFGLFDEELAVQATWTADFAQKYMSLGVGVGIWH